MTLATDEAVGKALCAPSLARLAAIGKALDGDPGP